MSDRISEKEFLKNYNIHEFDVPLTTIDMSIFTIRDGSLNVLLVKRAEHPSIGKWALPGGFINLDVDQNLEASARRKLCEKTGVDTPYLEQVATFGNKSRDPRGWAITIAYFALIDSEKTSLEKDYSSDEVAWVPIEKIEKSYYLAFDHEEILKACMHRLKAKVQYTSLPVHLLPKDFTLTELQQTFELILQKSVEKKSFRRRVLDAGILEETGELKTGSNRPAKLYRVKKGSVSHYFNRNLEGSRS